MGERERLYKSMMSSCEVGAGFVCAQTVFHGGLLVSVSVCTG